MKNLCFIILISIISGCSQLNPQHPNPATNATDKLGSTAYNTVVGAKGFLDSVKAAHAECINPISTPVCHTLKQATVAKDLLIDAGEEYCSGAQFETGGACNPPTKGTPRYQILSDKLKSSINLYNSIEKDLKGLK